MDYISLTAHVINLRSGTRAFLFFIFFPQKPYVGPQILFFFFFFLVQTPKGEEVQLPKINQRHHDACRVFVFP